MMFGEGAVEQNFDFWNKEKWLSTLFVKICNRGDWDQKSPCEGEQITKHWPFVLDLDVLYVYFVMLRWDSLHTLGL